MITPDNFRGRPLEYAGNQIGHMFIAAVIALALAVGGFWISGEYPQKIMIAAVVVAVYLMIELPQKGTFWDTIEDILFACGYGTALYLFSFNEQEPGNRILVLDPHDLIVPACIVGAHLSFGMLIRLVQSWGYTDG